MRIFKDLDKNGVNEVAMFLPWGTPASIGNLAESYYLHGHRISDFWDKISVTDHMVQ